MNKKYLFLGLIFFYLILSFSPHKLVYFGAYLVTVFFFYLSTKDLRMSFFYFLILSLFSDVGLAGSLFLVEPEELNFGSGYWISPMTVILVCLIPLSFNQKIKSLKFTDFIILAFFLWSLMGFFYFPYNSVLYGIFSLGEIVLLYFILRMYLTKENLKDVSRIIISMIIFQSIIGLIQFFLKRPIGILAESSTFLSPFGLVTAEDVNLYRFTGTFAHPNNFAASLLAILPFLFLAKVKNHRLLILYLIPLFVLFFTYSRAAWAIFIIIFILTLYRKRMHLNIPSVSPPLRILFVIFGFILFIFFAPPLVARINTIPQALEEKGSMDVRFKLFEEGLSLVGQYPLTGVGLNQSMAAYASSPVTDLLEFSRKFYRIHNLFLEIATEAGIPGLVIFVLFLLSIFWSYFNKEKNYIRNAAMLGFIALIGISMLNPFFHASQFRLFFLLSAIILV